METMRDLRKSREELKSYLKELKGKLKHVSMFDLNFFQKLEEGSKEQENMQSQLNQLIKEQMEKTKGKTKMAGDSHARRGSREPK